MTLKEYYFMGKQKMMEYRAFNDLERTVMELDLRLQKLEEKK